MKKTLAILLALLVLTVLLLPQPALAFLGIDFGGIGDIFKGFGDIFKVAAPVMPVVTKLLPADWQKTIGTATSAFNIAQTGWGVAGKVYDSFSGEAGYDFYNPPSGDVSSSYYMPPGQGYDFFNPPTEDVYSPYYIPPSEGYDFYNPPSEDVIEDTWYGIADLPEFGNALPEGYDFYNPPSEDVIENTWDKIGETPGVKEKLSGIIPGGPAGLQENIWKDIIKVPGVSKILGDIISGKTSKEEGLKDISAISGVKDKLTWNIPGLEGKAPAEILSNPDLIKKLVSAGFPQSALDNLSKSMKSVSEIKIESPITAKTFRELIAAILEFLKILALAISPIMIIIAGFQFVTAAGDPAKITTAKKIILYTLIGLAIVLLADALVDFLETVVKG